STNKGTTFREPTTNILPSKLFNHIPSSNQTLIALFYHKSIASVCNSRSHNCSNSSIHTGRITATGHDSNLLFLDLVRLDGLGIDDVSRLGAIQIRGLLCR